MALSKKHFRVLAEALHMTKPVNTGLAPMLEHQRRLQWNQDVSIVAGFCRTHNPRFDIEKFFWACEEGLNRKSQNNGGM